MVAAKIAELVMIDENLVRAELSPSERATQTARRKEICETLHPEAEAGAIRARAANESMDRDVADKLSATPFAEVIAAAIGKDVHTVRCNAERSEKVIDEVLDIFRGKSIGAGTYYDKLDKLPPNEQMLAAKRNLHAEREKAQPKPNSKKQGPVPTLGDC